MTALPIVYHIRHRKAAEEEGYPRISGTEISRKKCTQWILGTAGGRRRQQPQTELWCVAYAV